MTTTLSVVAALLIAVQVSALLVLNVLPTGYSPISDAVSDYGVGPFRGWFWLQVVSGGIACLLLGIALEQQHPFTPTTAVIALVVVAVARLLIPFFATDQGGSRFQTLHGTVHMLLAVLAFGGLVWAATSLWSSLRHYAVWERVSGPLTILPWVMLGAVVVVVLAIRGPRLRPWFGLFERLFYVSSVTWLMIVAVELAVYGPR